MRHGFWLSAFAGLALLVWASAATPQGARQGGKANDGVITDWGKPKAYEPGKVTAVWLWHDDGVWYFRTTSGKKKAHQFKGTIEVLGGKLLDLKGKKGEFSGKSADKFVFSPTAIAFDFKTEEGVDGLNFAVDAAATALRITVAVDGKASPKLIHVGKAGDHPSAAVFTVPAAPPAKGKTN